MTERQLRRIINEEINNILNEASQYAVPEEFEGIIANDPKFLLKRTILLTDKRYNELPYFGVENTHENMYALVVFFKDPLTNESVSEEPFSTGHVYNINATTFDSWLPLGIGIALSSNASELMKIANKISKQRGRLGSQLTRDLVCQGINTSKYVADICTIYDVNFNIFEDVPNIHLTSIFGTVTMEQEIQTQMFR